MWKGLIFVALRKVLKTVYHVFFQAEDGIRDRNVTGVQTCALPILMLALTTVLNNYGKKTNIIKGEDKVSGDDCREGLTCVISVKLTDAQFEGQTKAKLGKIGRASCRERCRGRGTAGREERQWIDIL